jgi:hypothetical protein
MRVGYSDDNCDFGAGLDNLRDGISGGIHGSVRRSYSAEGHSMVEVCLHDMQPWWFAFKASHTGGWMVVDPGWSIGCGSPLDGWILPRGDPTGAIQ